MKNKFILRECFPISLADTIKSVTIFAAAAGLCALLKVLNLETTHASMIFLLGVFLISRYTNGYLYGGVASVLSVLAVNFFFAYPYFRFNFTLAGYPLTIACSLAVAIITSTVTTRLKRQENIKIEIEREKTKSNLLRAVSHDLRTPLTSIYGASSAILENYSVLSEAEKIRLLEGMKEDSRWLIRMVENLLSVTRIDTDGETKITKKIEAAEEVIADCVCKFQKLFENINVSVSVPDEFLMVPMNAVLVGQVIINLMENAAMHGVDTKNIKISLECDGENAIFSVSDDGRGIDPKILPRIFDGDLKNDCDTIGDNKKKNLGIGLSVCNAIVHAHGGELYAENLKAGGARFTFTLPVEEEKNEK